MSAEPQTVRFNLAPQGFASSEAKTLLTTIDQLKNKAVVPEMSLPPFSVYIGELSKAPAEIGSQ